MSRPDANPSMTLRRIPVWAFLGIVVVYLAILQGGGLIANHAVDVSDGKLLTVKQVLVSLCLPLFLALVFTYGIVAWLGWWRPVLHDDKPVRRWVWFVPIALALAILIGIDYAELADKGMGFVLALLLATQLVGWGEEGMFRGLGVTTLRGNGLTEAKVALWSSVIFGAAHITNLISRGPSAFGQAIAVSFAGYFFYLVRRVSSGNALNSILHGLFDFALISGTSITAATKVYAGSLAPIAMYVVLAIVLLVRRHKIEPTVVAP